MSELSITDLYYVVRRIPRDVRDVISAQGLFVGGGFIRETIAGGKVSDIDVFGPSIVKLQAASRFLCAKRDGAKEHASANAITLLSPPRLPVQFITRWLFDDPDRLVSSFDFTVCQAVVWKDLASGQWRSRISDEFYQDLAARRLVYTSPVRVEDAGGSMLRVRKFLQRGYNIQAESLAAVIARLAYAVKMRGQISELGMTRELGKLLYEVDPLLVIDGFDPIDEHENMNGEV